MTPAAPTPTGPAPVIPSAAGLQVAQIIVTPPGTDFRVGGGPYIVPISINNATQVSIATMTLSYPAALLRVRTVQEGSFMRQGGAQAIFSQQVDGATGRIDITISRVADQTGASGAGLLAAVLFDAIAPGAATFQVSGVARTPAGLPLSLRFEPVSVTVR